MHVVPSQGMEAPLSGPELDSLKSKLQQHGQAHLLDHWESLTDAQQKQLYQELAPLDYAYLRHIFQASQQLATTDLKHVQPAQDVVTLADMTPAQRKQWTSSGLDMIAEVLQVDAQPVCTYVTMNLLRMATQSRSLTST